MKSYVMNQDDTSGWRRRVSGEKVRRLIGIDSEVRLGLIEKQEVQLNCREFRLSWVTVYTCLLID